MPVNSKMSQIQFFQESPGDILYKLMAPEAMPGTSQMETFDPDVPEPRKLEDDSSETEPFWYIVEEIDENEQPLKGSPSEELGQNPDVKPIKIEKTDEEEEAVSYVRANVNETFATRFEACIDLQKINPQEYLTNRLNKEFTPFLYFLQAEKFLSNMFLMPSKWTLPEITKEWEITPDFNDFMFSMIKVRMLRKPEVERHCVLCIDSRPIKEHFYYERKKDRRHSSSLSVYEPAKHVIVIMAKGLFADWEQLIMYFFIDAITSAELSSIIKETVDRLDNMTMYVHALVTKHSSIMRQFMDRNLISPEQPYFLAKGRKIFFFIDVPHLLIETRSELFECKLVLPEGAADSSHILTFYAMDKTRPIQLAPKLTSFHVLSADDRRTNVKMAAQVLSATVGAALMTYIGLGGLPSEAYATANFVLEIDRLFDIFNSSKVFTDNEFKKPFTGSRNQVKFLNQMNEKFYEMKMFYEKHDICSTTQLFRGWILSIKSLLGLRDSVRNVCDRIYTRRINLECLDKFFKTIHLQSKCPMAIDINEAFKESFCDNFLQDSNTVNFVEDVNIVLGSNTKE